ncbi:hypothetical protein J0J30_23155, partial [Vibrio vulnificus]|nr:hypothetical protein [Vibrio vulnificus]
MKAFKMIRGGCEAYLAHIIDKTLTYEDVKGISVVEEYPDVFPEDLSRLPPDREIEFTIELIPGTSP